MSAPRRSRRHTRTPGAAGLVAAAVLVLALAPWAEALARLVVVAAAVGAAVLIVRAVRRSRPPIGWRPVVRGEVVPPDDGGRAELSRQLAEARDQLARAEAERDQARESAQLAWDAAASAAPRCRFCRRELGADGECPAWCDDYPPARRAELLADPLSGARPLGTG